MTQRSPLAAADIALTTPGQGNTPVPAHGQARARDDRRQPGGGRRPQSSSRSSSSSRGPLPPPVARRDDPGGSPAATTTDGRRRCVAGGAGDSISAVGTLSARGRRPRSISASRPPGGSARSSRSRKLDLAPWVASSSTSASAVTTFAGRSVPLGWVPWAIARAITLVELRARPRAPTRAADGIGSFMCANIFANVGWAIEWDLSRYGLEQHAAERVDVRRGRSPFHPGLRSGRGVVRALPTNTPVRVMLPCESVRRRDPRSRSGKTCSSSPRSPRVIRDVRRLGRRGERAAGGGAAAQSARDRAPAAARRRDGSMPPDSFTSARQIRPVHPPHDQVQASRRTSPASYTGMMFGWSIDGGELGTRAGIARDTPRPRRAPGPSP